MRWTECEDYGRRLRGTLRELSRDGTVLATVYKEGSVGISSHPVTGESWCSNGEWTACWYATREVSVHASRHAAQRWCETMASRGAAEGEGVMGREMGAEELAEVRAWVFGPIDEESPVEILRDLLCHIDAIAAQRDDARERLRALVEATDACDEAGKDVDRLHRAWTSSWNNRTREKPVDDSIAAAASKAREAQRVAAGRFGAALAAARASVADPSARREVE